MPLYYLGLVPLIIALGFMLRDNWRLALIAVSPILIGVGITWFLAGVINAQTTKTTANVQQSEMMTCIEACVYKFK